MDDLVDIVTGGGKPRTDTPPPTSEKIATPVGAIEAAAPTTIPAAPIKPGLMNPPVPLGPNRIPLPDYSNQTSRNNYLKSWQQQYGPLEGRGDTVLKINETPRGASDTMKNMAVKYGQQYGIDPALLHASAMEEGASGLFKNKDGTDTKGRKPGDFGYQDYFGDKDFPVNGGQSFGFTTFAERFPDLVKGGYLPKEFANNFRGKTNEGQYSANDFKSTDAAMQAKAAMLKMHYDDIDSYAKKRGVALSPKARDFFALADYNGGEGTGHQMLNDYYNNGYLKDDKFLEKRPTSGKGLKESSYGAVSSTNEGIYAHVARRLKMRDNLKEQSLFQ